MKRSVFAELIGVSHQMVTKYVQDGVVTLDANGLVQVDASLRQLEGRLRPNKLQRAIAARQASIGAPIAETPPSPKLQRDIIDRDLKRVQLGRELGELVIAEDVDNAGRRAVAALRDSFAAARRESAERLAATFGIAPERVSALAASLGQELENALDAFAREMSREAVDLGTRKRSSGAAGGPFAPRDTLLL